MIRNKFLVGNQYTKNDIYEICDVPNSKRKGNWNTGYTQYEGSWFIFANVGVAGRTGHDYSNKFIDNNLQWYGKSQSHLEQESIKSLLSTDSEVLIFYREEDRSPFTFAGAAFAKSYKDETPVQVIWSFKNNEEYLPILPDEVAEPELYIEGATKTVSVNKYERSADARAKCLKQHGYSCAVCSFDFKSEFGDIGEGYIHVHHLKPLAEIGEEYTLDPVKDLRPVCPNCHSMIHRRKPAYSINELQAIREAQRK